VRVLLAAIEDASAFEVLADQQGDLMHVFAAEEAVAINVDAELVDRGQDIQLVDL
jgi:hypothetical protein